MKNIEINQNRKPAFDLSESWQTHFLFLSGLTTAHAGWMRYLWRIQSSNLYVILSRHPACISNHWWRYMNGQPEERMTITAQVPKTTEYCIRVCSTPSRFSVRNFPHTTHEKWATQDRRYGTIQMSVFFTPHLLLFSVQKNLPQNLAARFINEFDNTANIAYTALKVKANRKSLCYKAFSGFLYWIKKFSSPKMLNREFVFIPKIEYQLVAERSEANQNSLTFPFWCAHEESNLDYGIRNPASYPLNDER